jgi:hypothetical protein
LLGPQLLEKYLYAFSNFLMKLIGCKYTCNHSVSKIYFKFFFKESLGKFEVVGCRDSMTAHGPGFAQVG